MAKVITFSKTFPGYHPRAGEPTYFVEKFLKSIGKEYHTLPNTVQDIVDAYIMDSCLPKPHTIRLGQRFSAGDWFSPRVWEGIPYKSKQIIIEPDTQVAKTFEFEVKSEGDYTFIGIDEWAFYEENSNFITQREALETLAQNDGLTVADFKAWFKWPEGFKGQIICWNQKIDY